MESALLAAFLVGLAGGAHCIGMCGGIVAAVALRGDGLRASGRGAGALAATGDSLTGQLAFHAAFNAGRIASYVVGGAVVGAAGSLGLLLDAAVPAQLAMRVVASALVILVGLHVAGLGSSVVAGLERAGAGLWRVARRAGSGVFPPDTPARAIAAGGVWGWLPCGLVYSVLATALVSGSAGRGATVMLAFGLGTLPTLLTTGLVADRLRGALQRPAVRRAAGGLIAALGAFALVNTPGLGEQLRQGLLCLG